MKHKLKFKPKPTSKRADDHETTEANKMPTNNLGIVFRRRGWDIRPNENLTINNPSQPTTD